MASAPNHPLGKSLFESDKDASSDVVLVSLLTIFHMLWTCFLPCCSVYIVNFEHVIAGWDSASVRMHLINFRNELRIDFASTFRISLDWQFHQMTRKVWLIVPSTLGGSIFAWI